MTSPVKMSSFEAFFSPAMESKSASLVRSVARMSQKSEDLAMRIDEVAQKGFVFAGDTPAGAVKASAYTDIGTREILIDLSRSKYQVLLSLAYELINALNGDGFREIQKKSFEEAPTLSGSERYASAVLKEESEAVYFRTKVALDLRIKPEKVGLDGNYFKLFSTSGNKEEVCRQIFESMKESGTVYNGAYNAFKFYQAQYFEYNQTQSPKSKRLAHLMREEAYLAQ